MSNGVILAPYGAHPSELARAGNNADIAVAVRRELEPLLRPTPMHPPEAYTATANTLDEVSDFLARKVATDAVNRFTAPEARFWEQLGNRARQPVFNFIELMPAERATISRLMDSVANLDFTAGALSGHADAIDDLGKAGANIAREVAWSADEVVAWSSHRDVFKGAANILRNVHR